MCILFYAYISSCITVTAILSEGTLNYALYMKTNREKCRKKGNRMANINNTWDSGQSWTTPHTNSNQLESTAFHRTLLKHSSLVNQSGSLWYYTRLLEVIITLIFNVFCRILVLLKLRNCWTFSNEKMMNTMKDSVKRSKLQTRAVL